MLVKSLKCQIGLAAEAKDVDTGPGGNKLERSMRRLMVIFSGMMIAATSHVRALVWNTFSINQNPVPPNAIVSFSIGYPKGWNAFHDSNWRDDIYFDHPIGPSGENICIFSQPYPNANSTNWMNTISRSFTMVAIFYSHDRPAREAAESFAKGCTEKSLSSVETVAGDTGWLLESEHDFKIKVGPPPPMANFSGNDHNVVLKPVGGPDAHDDVEKVIGQEYFFHSGSKGSIRIEIVTSAGDSAFRSELDKLVLQTLRFGGS
ncbi:MAG TPA: hypothetical protein VME24_09105 [Alphaproteobacteria bacterium]|nr:hypothetical protein [Alphaproteobacteria bacterium]